MKYKQITLTMFVLLAIVMAGLFTQTAHAAAAVSGVKSASTSIHAGGQNDCPNDSRDDDSQDSMFAWHHHHHCDDGDDDDDDHNGDVTPPTVVSITRPDVGVPADAASIDFIVTFSEPVTGVDVTDFGLVTTGVTGASITSVTDSGDQTTYNVVVDTGSGSGTIQLVVNDSGTGIQDLASNPLEGGFTTGVVYTIIKNSAPTGVSLSNLSIDESLPVGSIVGTLATTDPNTGDSFTYSFCGGPDDAAFSITGDTLTTAEVFDYETKDSYSICIQTNDGNGGTFDQILTITINNITPPQTYSDVPTDYWAWPYIESLAQVGITEGCSTSPLMYCPEDPLTRAMAAVFFEKILHGSTFVPPVVPLSFTDTTNHWARYWIEALRADEVTSGCTPTTYCPDELVTRAQMAVLLLKAKHGGSYTPPTNVPITFTDTVGNWAQYWIEELAKEGFTNGCGPNLYCPGDPVTRAQLAVFLQQTFNLPIP